MFESARMVESVRGQTLVVGGLAVDRWWFQWREGECEVLVGHPRSWRSYLDRQSKFPVII